MEMPKTLSQPQNGVDGTSAMFSEEQKASLSLSLTRTHIQILQEIYKHPGIQQKALAVNIKTTDSGMSNLLHRIGMLKPPLLNIEKIGRSKYYFLTAIAQQYIEELQDGEPTNIRNISSIRSISRGTENKALQSLKQYQMQIGNSWTVQMDNMLISYREYDHKDELFNSFLFHLKQLRIDQDYSALQDIYDELKNEILIYRLQDLLEETYQNHTRLKPLFDLLKQDPPAAYAIIDRIFADIAPSGQKNFFGSIISVNEPAYSKDIYYSLISQLYRMVDEFESFSRDKNRVCLYWIHSYFYDDPVFYYIAEKCNTICQLKSTEKNVP